MKVASESVSKSVSNSIQYHLKFKIKKMKSEIDSINQSIRALQLWIAPPRRDESKISYYEFLSSSSCVSSKSKLLVFSFDFFSAIQKVLLNKTLSGTHTGSLERP